MTEKPAETLKSTSETLVDLIAEARRTGDEPAVRALVRALTLVELTRAGRGTGD